MITCKGLFVKAKEDKTDPLLAYLDWRNTLVRGSGPRQFSSQWVGALALCCQQPRNSSSQTVTPRPRQVTLLLGKDCSAGSTTEASRTLPLESRRCRLYEANWGEEMEPRPLLAKGHAKLRCKVGTTTETATRYRLLWSHHWYQATPLSLIRLRMKANHWLYQSFCHDIPTPRLLRCPDVPRQPVVPMPGLKIMNYVEHLDIDLYLLFVFWTLLFLFVLSL